MNSTRIDFDNYYITELEKIKNAPYSDLKRLRETHKSEVQFINKKLTATITPEYGSFLRGKRKMLTYLLADSRRRLKQVNKDLQIAMANHSAFIRMSSEHLHPQVFNQILKKATIQHQINK